MKKNYQDMDLEIIVFPSQDVITFSTLETSDYGDSEAMSDMYGDGWLSGLTK